MNRKVREPFLLTRMLNFLIGIIILALIVVVVVKDSNTEVFQRKKEYAVMYMPSCVQCF